MLKTVQVRRPVSKFLKATCLSLVPFLAAPGWAGPVTLTSPQEGIELTGELVDFTGDQYVIRTPALGDVWVDAEMIKCVGDTCPQLVFEIGADVTLTSRIGEDQLEGQLVDFKDGIYTLQSGFVTLTARGDEVVCTGPGCPQLAMVATDETTSEEQPEGPPPVRLEPDMVMVGSDRVGQELMPLIVGPFADALDAVVSEPVEFPDDIAQYVFVPKSGNTSEPFVLEVESTSSGPGLERLIENTTDIAMSSRGVEDDEVEALQQQGRGNLRDVDQEYVVAVDSIVMLVNKENPVDALSRSQLADIYEGRITNWAEVGGQNMPITVIGRPGGSARRIFSAWAYDREPQFTDRKVIIDGGKKLTREVMATPGGIGYSISDNALDAKVIDLILDCGIRTDATPFKSKSEEYLLGRRLRLYVDNNVEKPEVQKLLDLMISPQVDPLVSESGYYDLGLEPDPNAFVRLLDASLIGQPEDLGTAARGDISQQLNGATRLSLTFRFETDAFFLDSKALRDLDRLIEYLTRPENANREFIFVGFADTIGDYFYNVFLSKNRANEVLARARNHPKGGALRNMRLTATGFGEAAPVGCNDNTLGRSHNRRVEVWVR